MASPTATAALLRNRQPTQAEGIIYLTIACIFAFVYTVTTAGYYYLAPETPEIRKRGVTFTVVGAVASASITMVMLAHAASPSSTPSFLPLWAAYLGFAAWSMSLLSRVWRARFLADIRRAKARNGSAISAATPGKPMIHPLVPDAAREQLEREQSWLRRRRAPGGDLTLTALIVAIALSTLICLVLVQSFSVRYRLVPLDVGLHRWRHWEYIPFYVTVGFFTLVMCPLIVWLLLGLRDAYNVASDLSATAICTLLALPVYFIWSSVRPLEQAMDAILWLAVLLMVAHVLAVVRPVRRALRLRLERRLLSHCQFMRVLDTPSAFQRLERMAEADFSVENCRFIVAYRSLQRRTDRVLRHHRKLEEREREQRVQSAVDYLGTLQAAQVGMQTAAAMRALGLPGTVNVLPASPQHYHMAGRVAAAQQQQQHQQQQQQQLNVPLELDWQPPQLSRLSMSSTFDRLPLAAPPPGKYPSSSTGSQRPAPSIAPPSPSYSSPSSASGTIETAQRIQLTKSNTAPSLITRMQAPSIVVSVPEPARPLPLPPSDRVTQVIYRRIPGLTSPHTSALPAAPAPTAAAPRSGQPLRPAPRPHFSVSPLTPARPESRRLPLSPTGEPILPDWLIHDYRQFYDTFLATGALLEVNVDQPVRRRVQEAFITGHVVPSIFDEVYQVVIDLIYRNTFPRYVRSLLHTRQGDDDDVDSSHGGSFYAYQKGSPEMLEAGSTRSTTSTSIPEMAAHHGGVTDDHNLAGINTWDVAFPEQPGTPPAYAAHLHRKQRKRKRRFPLYRKMCRWWRQQMDELAAWREQRDQRYEQQYPTW